MVRKKILVGRHGEAALEAMYRLGGVSAEQLRELLGTGRTATYGTLRRLEADGLIEQTVDLAQWQPQAHRGGKPPSYYYLSGRYGGKGIEYGGYLAGIERGRDAKQSYRLHQLPARAAHSSLRNSYYLSLLEGASDAGVEIPWDSMWGESHSEHPLLAQEVDRGKDERVNSRKSYKRLYPDGSFEVVHDDAACTFMVEVETQVRGPKIRSKVNDYSGWFRRVGMIRPLVFLSRTDSQADGMRRAIREGIRERSEVLGEYIAYAGELGERVHLGRHVLVASTESIASRGAYAAVYRPLVKYADERTYVGLLDAARLAGEAREALIEDDEEEAA